MQLPVQWTVLIKHWSDKEEQDLTDSHWSTHWCWHWTPSGFMINILNNSLLGFMINSICQLVSVCCLYLEVFLIEMSHHWCLCWGWFELYSRRSPAYFMYNLKWSIIFYRKVAWIWICSEPTVKQSQKTCKKVNIVLWKRVVINFQAVQSFPFRGWFMLTWLHHRIFTHAQSCC